MHSAFWATYAACYDLAWDSPLTSSMADQVASGLRGSHSVADFGCGTGLFAAPVKNSGAQVYGLDGSPAMLRKAIRKGRVSVAVTADLAETGLVSNTLDAAICANVLHLHPKPERVLDEVVRVVRPGGRIALVTPSSELTHHQARRADRISGRSQVRTTTAHLARSMIAIYAQLAQVEVRAGVQVDDAIADAIQRHDLDTVTTQASPTQRLVLLRRPD